MDTFYTSYSSELTLQDVQTSVMASDGFVNNFFSVFLSEIMGIGNN